MKIILMLCSCLLLVNLVSAQQEMKKNYTINVKKVSGILEKQNQNTKDDDPKNVDFYQIKAGKKKPKKINLEDISNSNSDYEKIKCNVKFDGDKLYINPWLMPETPKSTPTKYINRDDTFYFKLKNRRSLRLPFRQWSFNAITVPLKIRIGDQNEYTTEFEIAGLIGHTWGSTKFVYRNNLDNKTYDAKLTAGLFLGAGALEFSYLNNSVEKDIKSAHLSTGLGVMYAYQKVTLGVVGGFDFGMGSETSNWKYHSKPWLGLAVGYDLFAF